LDLADPKILATAMLTFVVAAKEKGAHRCAPF
jgi:hypothetical protein